MSDIINFPTSDHLDLLLGATRKAYAPYSHFKVGAVLVCTDKNGQSVCFTGCNVENASYGLCMCAERVAIGKAISSGVTKFDFILVAAAY